MALFLQYSLMIWHQAEGIRAIDTLIFISSHYLGKNITIVFLKKQNYSLEEDKLA